MDTAPAERAGRRRWVLDVLLAIGVAWFMVAGWSFYNTFGVDEIRRGGPPWRGIRPDAGPMPLLVPASALLVAVGVVVRRSPIGLIVGSVGIAVYLYFDGAPVGAVLAAVVLAIGLLQGGRLTTRCPWLALSVVAFAAPAPLDLGNWLSVLSMLAWTALPVVAFLALRARRADRQRQRAEELDRIAHDERMRLARDIHDVVGHSLSLITLQSGVALKVLDDDPTQVRASLEAIRLTSKEALGEVKRTLGVFRDDQAPLAPTPDLDAIVGLVEQVRATGVSVSLTRTTGSEPVPVAVQAVAHRIVQEALTNAMRHAPGVVVAIELATRDQTLRVRVSDDGEAPEDIVEGGGLTGMRERVAALGGRIDIESGPGGFSITADLPLDGAS